MITKFKEFTNEKLDNVLFSHGGNIGGPHQKPIKDKDFNPTPTGIRHEVSYEIGKEKRTNRLKNLMGSELLKYDDLRDIKFIIDESERYKESSHENDKGFKLRNIKHYFSMLPDVSKHFDVDPESDESVIDFIENKLDLFKRSYEMFKEESNKYFDSRYNESKK